MSVIPQRMGIDLCLNTKAVHLRHRRGKDIPGRTPGAGVSLGQRILQRFGIADKVTFVVGQSAYGYYPLFDCFVQSSHKEGISIALLEAMSWGITCVVTNSDAKHPVLTANKDGLLIPAGDAQ